jgi:hypothetical protein
VAVAREVRRSRPEARRRVLSDDVPEIFERRPPVKLGPRKPQSRTGRWTKAPIGTKGPDNGRVEICPECSRHGSVTLGRDRGGTPVLRILHVRRETRPGVEFEEECVFRGVPAIHKLPGELVRRTAARFPDMRREVVS